jgi:hypothetical protein
LASEWLETDMSNNYLSFNGTDQYVSVPDDDVLDPELVDFSLCGFFDTFTNGRVLMWKSAGAAGWKLYIGNDVGDSGKIIMQFDDGTDTVNILTDKPSNSWHHIAVSIDRNGDGVIYIDSVAVKTQAISTGALTISNSASVLIGYSGSGAGYYDGHADDLRIYKGVALTAEQVATIYNNGHGKKYDASQLFGASSVVAFEFDEGSGTTTVSTGTALTGTLNGATTADMWHSGGVEFSLTPPPSAYAGNGNMAAILAAYEYDPMSRKWVLKKKKR